MFEIALEKDKMKEDKTPEEILAHKLKEFTEDIDEAFEEVFKVLAYEGIKPEDENKLIDIAANLKGSKAALGAILGNYSKVAPETRKKIDDRSDAFLAGLDGKSKADNMEE